MPKQQTWKWGFVFVTLLIALFLPATIQAHGVIVTYNLKSDGVIELVGEFDTGEPMGEAQVTIYAPSDPANPWLIGTADELGRYAFVFDPELLGTWDVQYRKAGHGDFIYIQLEAGMIDSALVKNPPGELKSIEVEAVAQGPAVISSGASTASSGFSSIQVLLMSASVIWGFVGTALYFSSKKSEPHDHSHDHGHHH